MRRLGLLVTQVCIREGRFVGVVLLQIIRRLILWLSFSVDLCSKSYERWYASPLDLVLSCIFCACGHVLSLDCLHVGLRPSHEATTLRRPPSIAFYHNEARYVHTLHGVFYYRSSEQFPSDLVADHPAVEFYSLLPSESTHASWPCSRRKHTTSSDISRRQDLLF